MEAFDRRQFLAPLETLHSKVVTKIDELESGGGGGGGYF